MNNQNKMIQRRKTVITVISVSMKEIQFLKHSRKKLPEGLILLNVIIITYILPFWSLGILFVLLCFVVFKEDLYQCLRLRKSGAAYEN